MAPRRASSRARVLRLGAEWTIEEEGETAAEQIVTHVQATPSSFT
jgi:hypothetical protein